MKNASINVTQARDNLAEILGRVKFGDEIITIEKQGKPYAIIMNPDEFQRYKEVARKAFLATVNNIQARNTSINEQELKDDIEQVTDEIRQTHYVQRGK